MHSVTESMDKRSTEGIYLFKNMFKECDLIKYSAYRTASKLRLIQKTLYMDKVRLEVIFNIFERHQLRKSENLKILDRNKLDEVLSDIYFAVEKENILALNTSVVLPSMINFLQDVYRIKNNNGVQVLSLKIGLTVLCQSKPREKYQYLFNQLSNQRNCLSKKKLEILLNEIVKITKYLSEGLTFGSELIPGTIESCFQSNKETQEVSEDNFISWLMRDPQLLVWFSTLYRMQISESVSHSAKCRICKICPIIGLRYRCLRCLSFDMCQFCFFTGKLNKKHKLTHPVQEYCCLMNPQQSAKAFIVTVKNKLYRKNSKTQYLPAIKLKPVESETIERNSKLSDEMEISSRTIISDFRTSQQFSCNDFQSVIFHLEKECETLISLLEKFFSKMETSEDKMQQPQIQNYVSQHKTQIKIQLQQLKSISNYLLSSRKFDAKAFMASTPVVHGLLSKNKKKPPNDLEYLSPIKRKEPEGSGQTTDMTWDNYDLLNRDSEASWEQLRSRKIFQSPTENEVDPATLAEAKHDDTEFFLSTWLGGRVLKEQNSTTNSSWLLFKNDAQESAEEQETKEDETKKTLEGLQSNLNEIVQKFNELSILTLKEEDESVVTDSQKQDCTPATEEVDGILKDLICGIEKLIA